MTLFHRVAALACAAALTAGLAGCATTASPEAMKAEAASFQLPKYPSAGKALVYVVRPGPEVYLAGYSPVFVYVDDAGVNEHVGYTRSGQYLAVDLTPGQHKIRSGMGGEVAFQAKAGEVRFLKQEAGLMGLTSLEEIDEITGKYLMKSKDIKPGSPSDKAK